MSTSAQIAANRRNGAKSKGPKTEAGRAVASRNALKHGLTARQIVLIFGEDEDDFVNFHDEMRASFAPADAVEERLVEHAVLCAWRLRRAYRAEAASMNAKLTGIHEFRKQRGTHKKWIPYPPIAFDLGTNWEVERISRYEVTNERALHRALLMLERRQMRRRNEPVPAPIAVQVEGLSAEAPIALIDSTASRQESPLPCEPSFSVTLPAESG